MIETIETKPINVKNNDLPAFGNSLGNSYFFGSVSFTFGVTSDVFVLGTFESSV